jgi:hypothetical protein
MSACVAKAFCRPDRSRQRGTRRSRALEFPLRVEAGGLVTDVGTPSGRFSRRIRLVGQQSLVHDWRDHGAGTVPPCDGRRPGRRVDQVPAEVPNLEVHARPISELSAAVVSPANSYGFVGGMIHAHYLELYRDHVQSGSAHNEDGRPPT